jgi:hypothetical protein
MFRIACFWLAIGIAMPAWSQVQPSAYGGGYDLDSEHMMTPPPVSRQGYPTSAGLEERSNILAGGATLSTGYTDNLMLLGNQKVSDELYMIVPTISLDRRTPRHAEMIMYGAGFRFYQNTSNLNAFTQNGMANFQYHFTPYAALVISNSVSQNSNLYTPGTPFSGGGVSGAPGTQNVAIIEPFADQIANTTSAGLEYQFSKNSMIGASGSYGLLHFRGHSNLPTLSDQNTSGGNAFYSRRFGKSYAGVTYQLSKYVTHPFGSYTLSNTVFGFYTRYFTRTLSVSFLGGPEHYSAWSETTLKSSAWTPAVQGSVGWQVAHVSLAANFAHVVSGAGGLIGTFHSDTGSLTGHMMFSRRWGAGAHAEYSRYRNLGGSAQIQQALYPGGDSISGGFEVRRAVREWLSLEAGYVHFHQNYASIAADRPLFDSNQATIAISYQFNRPLGR